MRKTPVVLLMIFLGAALAQEGQVGQFLTQVESLASDLYLSTDSSSRRTFRSATSDLMADFDQQLFTVPLDLFEGRPGSRRFTTRSDTDLVRRSFRDALDDFLSRVSSSRGSRNVDARERELRWLVITTARLKLEAEVRGLIAQNIGDGPLLNRPQFQSQLQNFLSSFGFPEGNTFRNDLNAAVDAAAPQPSGLADNRVPLDAVRLERLLEKALDKVDLEFLSSEAGTLGNEVVGDRASSLSRLDFSRQLDLLLNLYSPAMHSFFYRAGDPDLMPLFENLRRAASEAVSGDSFTARTLTTGFDNLETNLAQLRFRAFIQSAANDALSRDNTLRAAEFLREVQAIVDDLGEDVFDRDADAEQFTEDLILGVFQAIVRAEVDRNLFLDTVNFVVQDATGR